MNSRRTIAQTKMSWFDHAAAKNSSVQITLDTLCQLTADDKALHTQKVKHARAKLAAGDKAGYDRIKRQLPAVTISGVFNHRNKEKLVEYTQLLVLDIDKLSEQGRSVASARRLIESVATTCVCFMSPGGDGLKVIVPVSCRAVHHGFMIKRLMQYYEAVTQIKVDDSGKDTSRLCFLSHDPDVYVNYKAQIYHPAMDIQSRIDDARKYLNQKSIAVEGNRNNYVFELACTTNRYGLDQQIVVDYCCRTFAATDFPESEIIRAVGNGYRYKKEFGKWALKAAATNPQGATLSAAQLTKARKQLGIVDYVHDQATVVSVLVHELEYYDQDEYLVSLFIDTLKDIQPEISPKAAGIVLVAILKNQPKSVDQLLGNRSQMGPLGRQLASILSSPLPSEISERGKRILVQEYCAKISETTFQQSFAASSEITEVHLAGHVERLQALEKRHRRLTKDIIAGYKTALDISGEEE